MISDTLIYGNTYIAKFIISLIYITVNKFMNYFFFILWLKVYIPFYKNYIIKFVVKAKIGKLEHHSFGKIRDMNLCNNDS